MKKAMRLALVLTLSIGAGAAIWALSKPITGVAEPWDSDSPYLPAAIILTSFCLGFAFPRQFLLCPLGLLLGQMAFMVFCLPPDPLIGVGFLFLSSQVVFSLPLALAGSIARKSLIKAVA